MEVIEYVETISLERGRSEKCDQIHFLTNYLQQNRLLKK